MHCRTAVQAQIRISLKWILEKQPVRRAAFIQMVYELQPTHLANARNVVSRFSLNCSSGSDSTAQHRQYRLQDAGIKFECRQTKQLFLSLLRNVQTISLAHTPIKLVLTGLSGSKAAGA